MTLPRERTNAIHKAREFLRSLLDPKKTPKVPSQIRQEAYWVLKHFPNDYEINEVAKKSPDVFGSVENKDA